MWNLPNMVAMDRNENVYYCEVDHHRVVKFSIDGHFETQFGRIGQDEQGLYYPMGITIHNGVLYILDNEGKSLKSYHQDGRFINAVTFDEKTIYRADAIVIDNSNVYTDARYRSRDWKNKGLISVYFMEGQKRRAFGRAIIGDRIQLYLNRNIIYMEIRSGRIYGAYKYSPTIFCYTLEGKELFSLDLRTIDAGELFNSRFRHLEELDDGSNPNKVTSYVYFHDFSLDEYCNYQLIFNYFDLKDAHALIINTNGQPLKKIKFRNKGKPVFPLAKVFRSPTGKTYVIGSLPGSKELSLFKMRVKKN